MNKDITIILTLAKEDEHFLEKKLGNYSDYPIVISRTIGLGKARRECIDKVSTPYSLVLDLDTILPFDYLRMAMYKLDCPCKCTDKVAVVAIDYENLQGHLGMSGSLWKTDILKKLYDYIEGNVLCECVYMWRKVLQSGYKIETLNMRAIHVKEN